MQMNSCSCGGIGIRARLRILWALCSYGFKSRQLHELESLVYTRLFLLYLWFKSRCWKKRNSRTSNRHLTKVGNDRTMYINKLKAGHDTLPFLHISIYWIKCDEWRIAVVFYLDIAEKTCNISCKNQKRENGSFWIKIVFKRDICVDLSKVTAQCMLDGGSIMSLNYVYITF